MAVHLNWYSGFWSSARPHIEAELLKLDRHRMASCVDEEGVVSVDEMSESPSADINAWLLRHLFQYPIESYGE